MALTVTDIYGVRFADKLISLPLGVLAKIERLRVTPVPYKPVRVFNRNATRFRSTPTTPDNWRENVLKDFVRRVKEREDPEYSDIFSIFNRISPSNVDKLSADVVTLIQKRDQTFRLRVSMLLFDKAITGQSFFSSLMAECAARMHDAIPEISDDLQSQISMFPTLYNMTETLTYPKDVTDPYNEELIQWTKQKEKRRAYAKFMMELFALGLITEESVKTAFEQVVNELNSTACLEKTTQTEENTSQFATFLFECSKNTKGQLRAYLRESLDAFIKSPRESLPSLNMRSRFKVEDALKELNKEEKS